MLTKTTDITYEHLSEYCVLSAIYHLLGVGNTYTWFDSNSTITYPSVVTMDVFTCDGSDAIEGAFICVNPNEIYYIDYGNTYLMLPNDSRIKDNKYSLTKLDENQFLTFIYNCTDKTEATTESILQELKNVLGWHDLEASMLHVQLHSASTRSSVSHRDLLNELKIARHWITGYLANHPNLDWNRDGKCLSENYRACVKLVKPRTY